MIAAAKQARVWVGDLEAIVEDLKKVTDEIIAVRTGEQDDWRDESFIESLRLVRNARMVLELAVSEAQKESAGAPCLT